MSDSDRSGATRSHPAFPRVLLGGALGYAMWLGASILIAIRAEHVVREYEHSSASIPRLDRLAVALGEGHWHGLSITGALLCVGAATLPYARRSGQLARWAAASALFVVLAAVAVTVLERVAARAELAAAMASLADRGAALSAAPLALQLTWLWAPALYAGLSASLVRRGEAR